MYLTTYVVRYRCFGLLLSHGRNVKHSDMNLVEMVRSFVDHITQIHSQGKHLHLDHTGRTLHTSRQSACLPVWCDITHTGRTLHTSRQSACLPVWCDITHTGRTLHTSRQSDCLPVWCDITHTGRTLHTSRQSAWFPVWCDITHTGRTLHASRQGAWLPVWCDITHTGRTLHASRQSACLPVWCDITGTIENVLLSCNIVRIEFHLLHDFTPCVITKACIFTKTRGKHDVTPWLIMCRRESMCIHCSHFTYVSN